MHENPYRSPITLESRFTSRAEREVARPLSIALLSVFQILLGLSSIRAAILVAISSRNMELEVLSPLANGLVAIAAGIGMWPGLQWGWWLSTLHSAYLVVREYAIFTVAIMFGASYGEHLLNALLTSIVQLALLLIVFRPVALEFFDLDRMSKPRTLLILITASVVFVIFAIAVQIAMR